MSLLVRRQFLRLAVLSFALAACSSFPWSDGLDDEEERMRAERRRWDERALTSYEYREQVGCFCPPELTRPVIVTVMGDTIASVRYADTSAPVELQFRQFFHTIDELFERIARAIEEDAVELSVTYDAEWHYPTRIFIDTRRNVADEELTISASSLTPR